MTKKKKKNYLLLVNEEHMVSTMQEPHDSHMMSTEEVKRKKTGAEWGWGGEMT